MCSNVTQTIATTMTAIRPTLVSVLTILHVAQTDQGKAAIAAFDAADQALANWKQGTSAETVIQLIESFVQTFDAVVATVPVVPPEITALVNVISAGIVTVIGLIAANAPKPAPVPGGTTWSPEAGDEKLYQAHVVAETQAKVQQLVPGFKVSLWDKGRAALGDHSVVAKEYVKTWNKKVDEAAKVDSKYAGLKAA